MLDLTVIIPVYNEVKTINKILKKVHKIKIKKQIIVVDDGSTDASINVIKKYKSMINKICIHKRNLGKGSAIKTAQKHIKGNYVIIQDADLEYQPKDYLKILKILKKKKI